MAADFTDSYLAIFPPGGFFCDRSGREKNGPLVRAVKKEKEIKAIGKNERQEEERKGRLNYTFKQRTARAREKRKT